MTRAISAASTYGAHGRTSCKRQASCSSPLTGSRNGGKSGSVPLALEMVCGHDYPHERKDTAGLRQFGALRFHEVFRLG